jgi:hypothetical protein
MKAFSLIFAVSALMSGAIACSAPVNEVARLLSYRCFVSTD